MKISQRLSQDNSLRSLSEAETQLGQTVFEKNLNLTSADRVIIVTDAGLKDAAAVWFESAKPLTAHTTLVELEGLTRSGQAVSQEVLNLADQADVFILHTSYSLTHTALSKTAAANGARVASLPGVSAEIMHKTLGMDYQPVFELGQKLQSRLQSGTTIHITSPHGTDFTATIRPSHILNDSGLISSGEIGNLPAGEVFFAPIEESINGQIIWNASVADYEADAPEPILITIKDGRAVEIAGGPKAEKLQTQLTTVGPDAFQVAEIGIGTNPAADPHAPLIEAEKAYGTIHLALGNNAGFGGRIHVPIHLDGLTLDPEVAVDGQVILKEGQFLL